MRSALPLERKGFIGLPGTNVSPARELNGRTICLERFWRAKARINKSADDIAGIFTFPRGHASLGLTARPGAGGLYNANGEQVMDFSQTPTDYLSVKVPADQDGKLWSVRAMSRRFRLLNVPPFVASDAMTCSCQKRLLSEMGETEIELARHVQGSRQCKREERPTAFYR